MNSCTYGQACRQHQCDLCPQLASQVSWPSSGTAARDTTKSASREAQERQMSTSLAHKFVGLSAEQQDQFGLIHAVYTKSILNEPVSIPPMFIHINPMSPSITQPTTGPTALCKTPACLTTHLGMRIGVQLVLIDGNPHHFSMAELSCTV